MPYTAPTLPLECRVWHGPHQGTLPPAAAPDLDHVPCQLRPLRTASMVPQASSANAAVQVLLPPHTDVRPALRSNVGGDYIEVPSGSGRFYVVYQVEDVMKGFPTEYRWAGCRQLWDDQGVPVPPIP